MLQTPPLPDHAAITAELLRLAVEHGPDKNFCPSLAAQNLVGKQPDNWGRVMTPLRRAAVELAKDGKLVIFRKGKPADPADFKGVYRLGAPRVE